MAGDFDPRDNAQPAWAQLTDAERLHHLAVVEDHGGTSLQNRCPEHGLRLCADRVSSWTVLAGANLLPAIEDERAVERRAE
jgi:hypothetical protein